MSKDTITFELSSAVRRQLEDIAEKEHRTLSSQLRLIIEKFLEAQNGSEIS